MKYFTHPPHNADLTYAYETWIKRPEERGRLDGLLTACLSDEVSPERQRANVVSWRGVMTKILTAPYEERDGWLLNVMCVNGTLYFEEHLSSQKLKEKENMTDRNRLQSYFGYAFESYCTSATPDPGHDPGRLPNGWSGNIDTNVQWCSVVKTKLGDSRMIIGGEVDCVEGWRSDLSLLGLRFSSCSPGRYTGQPNTFVELKTSLTIRGPQDEARFEKKLLKFYFQSFLLGVPEIKVGFRTPAGRLKDLQSFKTVQLPRLVRGKPGAWDPNICLDFGSRFIIFLRSIIDDWDMGSSGSSPSSSSDILSESRAAGRKSRSKEECVWRVTFVPGRGPEVVLLDDAGVADVRNGEDRVGFLPTFYWDKVSARASKSKAKDDRKKST
ncbi:RAI1-domain-containing protein [Phellopilus nigrolimitatus]|nr:RAI1-domain-containing protein [Phellopilus nigrolimitatus]